VNGVPLPIGARCPRLADRTDRGAGKGVPNWKVGEECMTGSGDRYRILAIDMKVHEELEERGINGMFVVEPE
jgi:hypothetical protein